uniref:Zona pellucida sperm-binding protein 3 n=1 Tax=Monopterus albus TaxID=43700 RepID=A0A3Q3IUI7_MONAL|nr:zona pellucida sperm-binding protein 3-like [Monopterus albus]
MNIKWYLYILWSVLLLGLLSCAADTYESKFTKTKNVFKLRTSKSKTIKLSLPGDREPSQGLSAGASASSPLGSQRPDPPPPLAPLRFVRPGKPEANIQSDFAYVPDVSVTCSTSDFVVRVKPSFYGLGADAEELKLGSSCKSNGVLRPYGDLLFSYPLTACDSVRELPHGYLLYKFVLRYEPSPKRFPNRAHPVDVDIECRYQRSRHVYQLAVKPTWQTVVVRKRLKGRPSDFQIELMDDSWSKAATSRVYLLGQTVNLQVTYLPTGEKLYISSCYATPSSYYKSSLKYTIIDNFGCMLDSKSDPGASQFISWTNKTMRFSIKAFQFTADPDTEVRIHCKLSITSEDPGPTHKSCTYRGNRWEALTGDDSICDCCDSVCATYKPQRAVIEGSASTRSLLVSDQPYTAEDSSLPVRPSSVSIREGEAIVYRYTDEIHSHENLWEHADVIKYDGKEQEGHMEEEFEEGGRVILAGVTEPDVLGEEEKSEATSNVLGEARSGNEVANFLGREEQEERAEGREDEISDVGQMKEGEVLPDWAQLGQVKVSTQREAQLHNATDDTVRGEEERMSISETEWKNDGLADIADNSEMTWYFTWT